MKMKRLPIIIILTAVTTLTVFTEPSDNQTQTSPDGKWIVLVKPGHGPKIAAAAAIDDIAPTELWQRDAQGKHLTLLAQCHNAKNMEDVVAGFHNLQFSTDGKLVYFSTPAWTTSPAIHVVDTTTRQEHFVIDSVERVASTGDGDRLIVTRRDADDKGVFHDIFMVTPEGKLVGRLWLKER